MYFLKRGRSKSFGKNIFSKRRQFWRLIQWSNGGPFVQKKSEILPRWLIMGLRFYPGILAQPDRKYVYFLLNAFPANHLWITCLTIRLQTHYEPSAMHSTIFLKFEI